MPRYHDRDYFYKYVTKDVAKAIIRNHTLRWSCPLEFNDPFDHRYAFIDESRLESITDLIIQRFETYIWERDDIRFDETTFWGPTLLQFRKKRDSIPREELRKSAAAIRQQTIENGRRALIEWSQVTELMLLQTRVLCLAEQNDNLLMWAHYGSAHTGAVIKLNAIDDLDVPLLVAKQVRYSDEYPSLVDEEEFVDHILCVNRIDMGKREPELLLVKGKDSAYEQEWRISITDSRYPLGGFIDFEEPAAVFGAIYLGCRMPKEDREEVQILVKKRLPGMEIWQAIQGRKSYSLEFERVR
jgi:hypothetical protein